MPLCLRGVNPTIKFLPQVDVEASEPKIVSIDRVKVKSGLIIIDNPSGGEPGQKEYLVKSKRIWNKSKSQVAPRMLSHEHELRWWQPKASGERTVGGFLTSRDFDNLKSMNAFVEDCKKGSLLIFSQFPNHCTMLLSCFLFTFSLQTSKAEVSENSRSREFSTRVSFIFSRSTTRNDFLKSRSCLETWE